MYCLDHMNQITEYIIILLLAMLHLVDSVGFFLVYQTGLFVHQLTFTCYIKTFIIDIKQTVYIYVYIIYL